ncbi:MAG: (4Fe-4S)-binding protein [candidate division Zixibacteria bacterium SM1_73]|nr:MAG: (4Fe-4S)-binding protein [candidate division Zixibacteria bacterium SM1_73]
MKQLTVISGKGGTGKTVITASFAALAEKKVMADCDVDAADLYLLLHPAIKETHEFRGGMKAILNEEVCTDCGKCLEVCRFDAIREDEKHNSEKQIQTTIDPISCEGCGVCALICPVEAIQMQENLSGEWYVSDTKYGPMVHARLGIAEENSGKLVTVVRQNARLIAEKNKLDLVIVDGPPGIGCPVIASITGVDLVMAVTEPTISAISDLERVLALVRHFEIEPVVLINKYDINLENTEKITNFCEKENIEIVGKIPFDNTFTQAMVEGKTVMEYKDSDLVERIKNIWERISTRIRK